jgi:hypothetical protein
MRDLMGGVVHKHIDPTELFQALRDDIDTVSLLLNIAWNLERSTPCVANDLSRLLSVVVFVEIRDNDIRPFAGEGDRDSPTNTTITSCDNRHSAR